MGGQGPKKVKFKKRHKKYAKSTQASLSSADLVHVAKEVAPFVAAATGHQEVAAGIEAFADAYSTYQETHSPDKSVYRGVSTFVIRSTPGLIASWAVGSAEDQLGHKIDKSVRPAVEYGVERGVEYIEKRTFEAAERRLWPK